MNNEVEFKLEIAERDVWRLLRLPLINAVTLKKFPGRRLQNTYYDTADYRLRERGIAVRLRQVGGKWLQTIKTEGRVTAGLHERPEWESETTANTFDFSSLQDTELKSLLEKTLAGATLQPMFSTDFNRLSRVLQLSDGAQCEFCIDRGKIIAGDKEAAISELELEMIAGHPVGLFDFVRSLLEHVPLKLARDSKAARGFALALGTVAKPMKASQAPLAKHMTTQQGFVAISTACMDQLMANEAGCIAAADTEYLHQMRVAIRRLRTAIRLFADHLDAERMNVIVEELRWLGTQLGTTRDFDVFLEETLPSVIAAWPQYQGLTQVRDDIAARRDVALAASRAAVQSVRYQRLLLDIGAWLVALSQPVTAVTNGSDRAKLSEFANDALKRHRKQLIRRAHHLMELSAEERHRVRISGKRLRYAAEFFSPLFPAKRSKLYIQELANLQTILGVLNDAATTKTILSLMATEKNNEALAIVQTWVSGVTHGHLAHLPLAHNRFLEQQKFW
jgi:triphosphatase